MVKRSPCRSHAAVHGVDRVNDISELVQACRQGSLLHESSERHLLGNDDQSSVWPLPKVPGCVNAKRKVALPQDGVSYAVMRYALHAVAIIHDA